MYPLSTNLLNLTLMSLILPIFYKHCLDAKGKFTQYVIKYDYSNNKYELNFWITVDHN